MYHACIHSIGAGALPRRVQGQPEPRRRRCFQRRGRPLLRRVCGVTTCGSCLCSAPMHSLSSSGRICSPLAAVLSSSSSTHHYPLFFALRWQDGEKSGRGAYKWAADGRVYRGEWRHNKANGVGLLTRPSKPLQSSSSSPRSPKLSSTEVPFLFTLAIVRPYANTSASKPLSLLFLPFQMWLHLNL